MNARLLLAAALFLPLTAAAQIYEYKDAAGRTVYTDQPPTGQVIKGRTVAKEAAGPASTSTANAAPKSVADRELDFKKRQKEQQEAAAKAEKETTTKQARKEDCEQARRNLQIFESGERVATRDENGERVYLDDNQRAAEAERARKAVSELCK